MKGMRAGEREKEKAFLRDFAFSSNLSLKLTMRNINTPFEGFQHTNVG